VAYLLKARTMKPAETAGSANMLLLGNRFVTCNNGVTGKQCSLCSPCDSYVMQKQKNCLEMCFLCSPWRGYIRS
jgi:hypothetical protein